MANFYTDIPELKYHLNNPMMERICQLKERDYRDKDEFDYAPQDYADAMDSYDKILEITGEITGETIAPNAEGVDHEGPVCANNRVTYASGTAANLEEVITIIFPLPPIFVLVVSRKVSTIISAFWLILYGCNS
jgi:hypothetical protein